VFDRFGYSMPAEMYSEISKTSSVC